MRSRTLGYWALVVMGLAVLAWLAGWLIVGPNGWRAGWGLLPWMGGSLGGPMMLLMMLSMVLFWGALILGTVWLIRWLVEQAAQGRAGEPDALELARRRYARGEISREEYERLRDDLKRET
jgi:putative membrane protein